MPLRSAAVTLLTLSVAQSEAPPAMDADGYRGRLVRAERDIAAAATLNEGRGIAAAVPDRWVVTIDGTTLTVDMRWMDTAAARIVDPGQWPRTRQEIQSRLRTMRAEASRAAVVHRRPPRDVLSEVLARPEFQHSPASVWFEAQRRRLVDWLVRTLNRITGSRADGRTLALLFAWLAAVLALGALAAWLAVVLARRSGAATLELHTVPPRRPPARQWGLRALHAAHAGDVREAVRCAYRAALSRLDEQGLWRIDESRTPREYLRLLRRDDPRHPAVAALTTQFEQVCYAGRAASGEDARQLTANLESLGCVYASDRAS